MLLNGGKYDGKMYISPAAFKQMTSMQTGDILVGNGEWGYGLGFFVERKTTPGDVSVGSFGHHRARKTQMWIDPQNGLVMVLMVQCAELTNHPQHDLYAAYHKQAIARFGTATATTRHRTDRHSADESRFIGLICRALIRSPLQSHRLRFGYVQVITVAGGAGDR